VPDNPVLENQTHHADAVSGVEIVLEGVTKRYPGQKQAAVQDVSMTIPAGKITVFVGPSGRRAAARPPP